MEKHSKADPIDWETPATTVDISVFTVIDHEICVLLIKRESEPHAGQWALPGGFINVGKDANLVQAAERTLGEKTAVRAFLQQVGSVGGLGRDERGWLLTVLYFALVKSDETAHELLSRRWLWGNQRFSIEDLDPFFPPSQLLRFRSGLRIPPAPAQ